MVISPEWLIGPAAALFLGLWVISELWKSHKATDADVRRDRDEWRDRWIAADERLDALAEVLKKAAPK